MQYAGSVINWIAFVRWHIMTLVLLCNKRIQNKKSTVTGIILGHQQRSCYLLEHITTEAPYYTPVLSKVDDFATFKKVEVHAKNSTF